jgi:hypothetical protein
MPTGRGDASECGERARVRQKPSLERKYSFQKTKFKNYGKNSHQREDDSGERERRGSEAKILKLQIQAR